MEIIFLEQQHKLYNLFSWEIEVKEIDQNRLDNLQFWKVPRRNYYILVLITVSQIFLKFGIWLYLQIIMKSSHNFLKYDTLDHLSFCFKFRLIWWAGPCIIYLSYHKSWGTYNTEPKRMTEVCSNGTLSQNFLKVTKNVWLKLSL